MDVNLKWDADKDTTKAVWMKTTLEGTTQRVAGDFSVGMPGWQVSWMCCSNP